MPIISGDTYKKPAYLINKHFETIIPSAFRKVEGVHYDRERINTPDNDFLDIDWLTPQKSDSLVIISHGLEGNSGRPYVRGVAKLFSQEGWHALAWNCRSCSGVMNKTEKLYHHGYTEDLSLVVNHAISKGYEKIVLVGFSMGRSLSLKYCGETGSQIPKQVKAAVAVSVPCCLVDSVGVIEEKANWFYRERFLKKLRKKLIEKSVDYPELFSVETIQKTNNFFDFDTRFTSKIYGYKDAGDFYRQVQSINFLSGITVPTLLINAQNDPLLSPSSFPYQQAEQSKHLNLLVTKYGGHVGYLQRNSEFTWSEIKALEFIKEKG